MVTYGSTDTDKNRRLPSISTTPMGVKPRRNRMPMIVRPTMRLLFFVNKA